MVYLPTWMVNLYGFHVGKYTKRSQRSTSIFEPVNPPNQGRLLQSKQGAPFGFQVPIQNYVTNHDNFEIPKTLNQSVWLMVTMSCRGVLHGKPLLRSNFWSQNWTTRRAPSSYKWSYNPYRWPYKWVTGVIIPINGVITLLIIGRGPP